MGFVLLAPVLFVAYHTGYIRIPGSRAMLGDHRIYESTLELKPQHGGHSENCPCASEGPAMRGEWGGPGQAAQEDQNHIRDLKLGCC